MPSIPLENPNPAMLENAAPPSSAAAPGGFAPQSSQLYEKRRL